jgi:O-antigen ligase
MIINKSIPRISSESLKITIFIIITILFSAIGFAFFGVKAILAVSGFLFFLVLIPNLFVTFIVFTFFLAYIGSPEVDNFLRYFTDIWFYAYTALAASWIYHAFTHPQRIYVHVPLTLLFLLYLLVCLLSLFGSFDLSIVEPYHIKFITYRRVLEPLLTCSLLVFSMSAFEKEYQLEKIFWVIILTGIPLSLLVFFIGEFGYFLRAIENVGIFMGQHTAAQHIMFCTIMAFYLYKSTASKKKQYILLACCILFLFIEIRILSRSVLISFFIIILISPLLEGNFKKLSFLIIGFTITLFLLYPFLPLNMRNALMTVFSFLIGDVETSIMPTDVIGENLGSPGLRINDIKIGLSVATRNPLLGVGIGKSGWVPDVMYHPTGLLHNYYIVVLVETGIIGLFLFLGIIFLTLFLAYRSLKYYRQIRNFKMYSLTKGMFLSIISILIVFSAMPGWAEGERILFVLIGLIAAVDRLRDRQKKQTDKQK